MTDAHGVSATSTVSVLVAPPATPNGQVWLDQSGTGIDTPGDSGVAGVRVYLLDNTGSFVDETQTDINGNYQFTGIARGTYSVEVDPGSGYGLTAQGQGTDPTLASAFDPTTGLSASIALVAGQVDNGPGAGLVAVPVPGTVAGWAWQDSNANGLQDGSEAGIPNVVVTLTGSDGTSYSTTTDANGAYEFDGLTLGTTYTVSASAPSGQTLEGYFQDDGTPLTIASATPTADQPVADIDAAFMGSPSATTATSLSASTLSSIAGQAVTFTASVSPAGGMGFPSGMVQFYDGSTFLAAETLSAGAQATFATSALAVGSHSITAIYGGDATYAGVTSSAVTETVQQAIVPTAQVWLSTSSQSTTVGGAVTFTASISTTGPTPSGTVTFLDNGTAISTVAIGSWMMGVQATFTTSALAAGSHVITATYSGDATYAASTASLNQTVMKASDMLTLGASSLTLSVNEAVTLTATVSPAATSLVPTGTVSFYDNGILVATVLLSQNMMNVQAAFVDPGLTAGNHTLTAVYGGDQNFVGGSFSLSVTVS